MLHVHVWPKVFKKIIKNWRKARIVYIAIQFSWYCNNGPEKNIIAQEISFNPLSPSIHIQILQTDLRAFPLRISWENLIKHQGIFSFMIIFYILTTFSLDNVWTLSSKCCYFNFFFIFSTDLTDRSSFERAKFWVNELKTYEDVCIKNNRMPLSFWLMMRFRRLKK